MQNRSVGRFKQSFVKQFAGQELYSLLRRTQVGAASSLLAPCHKWTAQAHPLPAALLRSGLQSTP